MADLETPASQSAPAGKSSSTSTGSSKPFEPSPRGRLWLMIAAVLAVIGLAISAYSIVHHREVKALGLTDAACNINATINCDEVARSKYAEIGSVPLGVFGFGYFAAMLALIVTGMLGNKVSREHLYAYGAMVGIGVSSSLILAGISFTEIGAICLACVGIYTVTILQAVALGVFRSEMPRGFNFKEAISGGTTAAIVVSAVVAGYSWLLPPVQTKGAHTAASDGSPAIPNAALSPNKQDIPITRSAFGGLGEDYRRGPDTAKVVIVEFADFQCPACSQVSSSLKALAMEYGDRVQVVFRNYPLDNSCNSSMQGKMHEFSCDAAAMARCVGQYGKFWQMHDRIFENQRSINENNLKAWAKELGLTDEQVAACWKNADALAKVKDDVATGNRLGVDATPTLFINGQKVVGGKSMNDLKAEIDKLLN